MRFAAVLVAALAACSEQPGPAVVHVLGNQSVAMKFRIPPAYRAVSEGGRYIVLQAGYPSMAPAASKSPQEKTINVALLAVHGVTQGEEILSPATTPRGAPTYTAEGMHGAVQRYKRNVAGPHPRDESTYYVFRAGDGQVVLVIDDGAWAQSLRLYRRIGANAMLSTNLPKSDTTRLVEADATLMRFVRSLAVRE